MTQDKWNDVDEFIVGALVGHDPALAGALSASDAGGLPQIAVAPNQGKLLHLLAKMLGAKRILEVGTLGGYSSIWMARALPADGRLVTLEFDPHHAEVARANLKAAGLADRVEVMTGPALDSLPKLTGPFDLVFIDADKANNPNYFAWAMRLTRPGSLIIVDNVIRGGRVLEAGSSDAAVIGTRRLYEVVAAESRVTATALQTVGSKGYDGLLIARVNTD
jgi:predicted O-methyltransferase YrrM